MIFFIVYYKPHLYFCFKLNDKICVELYVCLMPNKKPKY
jgi:hypothetical protein